MRIGVLSQNLGELTESPFLNETSILSLTPHLYIEMTQEDGRRQDGTPLVEPSLLQDYTHLTSVSLNGNQQTHQNILMNVYARQGQQLSVVAEGHEIIAPKDSKLRLGLQTIAKALHTGYGYSKGMVYVKIKSPTKSLLFINMHLPVKTKAVNGVLKDETLGLDVRRAAFFELLEKLSKSGILDDEPAVFVAGDLNFRMDKYGRNQLNTIIQNEPNRILNLKELWQSPGEKKLTCKFTKKNAACRLRNVPEHNLENFLNNIQEDCGNSMRTPSRCDRFLVSDKPLIRVRLNTVKYLIESSDHNAILCCYDLIIKPPPNNSRTLKRIPNGRNRSRTV